MEKVKNKKWLASTGVLKFVMDATGFEPMSSTLEPLQWVALTIWTTHPVITFNIQLRIEKGLRVFECGK